MRALTPLRALCVLFTVSCFLIFALVPRYDLLDAMAMNILLPRQGITVSPPEVSSSAPALPTQTQASSTQQTSSSSSASPSSTQSSSSTSSASTAPPSSSSTLPPSTTSTSNAPPTTTIPPSSIFESTSALVTTDQGGQVVTSIIIVSDTPSTSSTPSHTAASDGSSDGSSGISTSTIIGLSVAGGIALLGIIGFFVWKFTRKRMHDFNDNEEIKWPELNAHDTNVPLPTNRTGGAGFDTTADGRRNSVGYAPSTAANSTAELYPDPYAVPPLPHLNPNQPYHDDPNAAFYDPYRGPIPQTFDQVGPGEAIPMTQLAGRRSPGPDAAYGGEYGSGRASPGAQAAYGGADFSGRASPAGPRTGYPGGRVSPGPQAAYSNHGPR
ncbi:hypothetical protein B0F90DRAFT_1707229 [Multifurca ochricompacta]|uniref:Transmembrane protein n=1 Tax=Multifurca ochricompacta TaxID=376703 RepID=A0AAD4M8G9_9AGAM|nr:hypothetical protein B0F90DRAFT_1707229 [Multifurca ochricompacta]